MLYRFLYELTMLWSHGHTVSQYYGLLQAISVIVTHRTDDMTKLPPRLPVNAAKPRKAAAPNRPKLRLGQVAKPSEAAPAGPAPGPSEAAPGSPAPGPSMHGGDASLSGGSGGELGEEVGEVKSCGGPAAFASPAKVHPGKASIDSLTLPLHWHRLIALVSLAQSCCCCTAAAACCCCRC